MTGWLDAYDNGDILRPSVILVVNRTGKPERVLAPEQTRPPTANEEES